MFGKILSHVNAWVMNGQTSKKYVSIAMGQIKRVMLSGTHTSLKLYSEGNLISDAWKYFLVIIKINTEHLLWKNILPIAHICGKINVPNIHGPGTLPFTLQGNVL